jgi:glycerol-3-phosphate O-acyltransferase
MKRFFIEGTRSRTGKSLPPKLGILSIVTDAMYDNKVSDIKIMPISINYEKVLEADTYPYELLGEEKVKESLLRVIRAASILTANYGRIYIEFGNLISLREFSKSYCEVSCGRSVE